MILKNRFQLHSPIQVIRGFPWNPPGQRWTKDFFRIWWLITVGWGFFSDIHYMIKLAQWSLTYLNEAAFLLCICCHWQQLFNHTVAAKLWQVSSFIQIGQTLFCRPDRIVHPVVRRWIKASNYRVPEKRGSLNLVYLVKCQSQNHCWIFMGRVIYTIWLLSMQITPQFEGPIVGR